MVSYLSDGEYLEVMSSILLTEPFKGHNPQEPAKVMEGVYLGSLRNAESWKTLEKLNITHVLNCAAYKGPRTYFGTPYDGLNIEYHEFPADDTDSYDITRHFPESFRFIDKARQRGGNVLVHCALGINRSGAVCLAYLMERCKLPILKATKHLKSKRRVLLSNPGFQKLLVRFARRKGLLDMPRDEIFLKYNLPSSQKSKSMRQRSQSCGRIPKSRTFEIIWPDDKISLLGGALDQLIISDAPPNGYNGYVTTHQYKLLPEISLRPTPRHSASLSRFDLYYP